ncbi:hypothetical protein [Streptomyces sp. NBC_00658]|uniref:hypothetical protein n=1 Tax=Streptomyces sp. NBC_00658 TaxID=2975800 RepID=UPI00324C309B
MCAQDPVTGSSSRQIPDRAHAVGPGWLPLLGRLHERVITAWPGYQLVDLKEKFGGLRIRLEFPEGSESSTLRALVEAAEEEAAVTCEFCGALGRARTRGDVPGGWLKTVCDNCHLAWTAHQIMIINGVVRRRSA